MASQETELIDKAFLVAKNTFSMLEIGKPLIKKRGDELCIDVPLLYNGFAVDRVHYDPQYNIFAPKGKPCFKFSGNVSPDDIKQRSESLIKEATVLNLVEFREPENAWAFPVVWGKFIIAFIKVSYEGKYIVPDYALTGELKLRIGA